VYAASRHSLVPPPAPSTGLAHAAPRPDAPAPPPPPPTAPPAPAPPPARELQRSPQPARARAGLGCFACFAPRAADNASGAGGLPPSPEPSAHGGRNKLFGLPEPGPEVYAMAAKQQVVTVALPAPRGTSPPLLRPSGGPGPLNAIEECE
jgi:hypothetical protein